MQGKHARLYVFSMQVSLLWLRSETEGDRYKLYKYVYVRSQSIIPSFFLF